MRRSLFTSVVFLFLSISVVKPQLSVAQQPDAAVPDNSADDLKDYVPCLMDRQSLFAMRGRNASQQNKTVDPQTAVSYTETERVIKDSSKQFTEPDDLNFFVKNANDAVSAMIADKKLLTYGAIDDIVAASAKKTGESAKERLPKDKDSHVDADKALKIDSQVKSAQAAAVATSTKTVVYPRPTDIGCSMSVYPWSVAHMVFGRTVADHYLAVQVTVRNLDPDHEFLIHDAELAVDAASGQLERFQEGHEKEAVRAVTLFGQNYDRRAVFSHAVEGIGIILGAVVGLPQPSLDNLTAASGAYSAGFMPTFQKLFPDLTTSNLNNLNDLGFSAAAASRIVVPKGGAVPFVIFVPIEPLEQACWLQKGYVASKDFLPSTACDAIYRSMKTKQLPALGYGPVTQQDPMSWDKKSWPVKSEKRAYSHWSPNDILALQKHAYAVVAGTHIAPVSSQSSALRLITCSGTTDNNGVLRLADAVGKSINCVLTGTALDTVVTLRLKSLANPSTAPINLTLVQTSDSTTAKVMFSADNITNLTDPSYELYGVDKSGTETDLHQTFSVVPVPTAASVTPASSITISAIPAAGTTVQVTGTNLTQVKSIQLQLGTSTPVTAVAISSSSTTATATFTKTAITAPGSYTINLVVDEAGKVIVPTTQSVVFN